MGIFPDTIDVEIHTINSEAAKEYVFKGSTTIFLDDEQVPLQTALDATALQKYIQSKGGSAR